MTIVVHTKSTEGGGESQMPWQGEIKPNRREAGSGAGLMWLLALAGRQGRLSTMAHMKV